MKEILNSKEKIIIFILTMTTIFFAVAFISNVVNTNKNLDKIIYRAKKEAENTLISSGIATYTKDIENNVGADEMRENIKIRKFILLFLYFHEWVMENLRSKFYCIWASVLRRQWPKRKNKNNSAFKNKKKIGMHIVGAIINRPHIKGNDLENNKNFRRI